MSRSYPGGDFKGWLVVSLTAVFGLAAACDGVGRTAVSADIGRPDVCSAQCTGKECGDDGCGGNCGACAGDLVCAWTGQCEDVGLVWVSISGGTFQMGCSPDDSACKPDEFPSHVVTLSDFEMLETEVTLSQYEAVMGENVWISAKGPDYPVVLDTPWFVDSYCAALGGTLPTEAQWEYAARGGTTTRYYCGDDWHCLDDIAWWYGNSGAQIHPVKEKAPNAYGLYDMLGNAWEWVADGYAPYTAVSALDPLEPNGASTRVVRGGGCVYESGSVHEVPSYDELRVSARDSSKYVGGKAGWLSPTAPVGVRCVRPVEK